MNETKQQIIYCDHSATTPMADEVLREMERVLHSVWGNPSSIHQTGRAAKVELEMARESIADVLHASRNEIIFTSGGTESDNLALRGLAQAFKHRGNHLITSQVEHPAVLHTCGILEQEGFEVTYLDVNEFGMIEPSTVELAIRDDTVLISIMHANNEIGTINPIEEIGSLARERGVPFHSDTVQSFGKMEIDVRSLPIDALSVSGHKIYGPKGIGFLYINQKLDLTPQITGGMQERHLRAGTENLPAIAGLAAAARYARKNLTDLSSRLHRLQTDLESELLQRIPDVTIQGHPTQRLPGLTHLSFQGIDAQSLVMNLDMRDIQVSNGAACSSGSVKPSHVLQALGWSEQRARSGVRISLGRDNTGEELSQIADALVDEVEQLRSVTRSKTSAEKVDRQKMTETNL